MKQAMEYAATTSGLVCGRQQGNCMVFKGIPYAKAPIGCRRWKAPQPLIQPDAFISATDFGAPCIQPGAPGGSFYEKEFFSDSRCLDDMSEDCLYLNIWVPAEGTRTENLPVAVWLHGGALLNGYGHEIAMDGEALCSQGVILVTINYRLNIFGYFSHPWLSEESARQSSGNYGMLDQVFALHWVKENIGAFGGNAGNVTLFGQSAGARSAQAICSSDSACSLFHKVILQSGLGIDPQRDIIALKEHEEAGMRFTDHIGVKSLSELRSLKAKPLMCEYMDFLDITQGYCGLVADRHLLTESLSQAALNGHMHRIPYIIGTMADEMQHIFPDSQNGSRWRVATEQWADVCVQNQSHPCYVYYFDHPLPGDDAGAFHSGDLWYMFGTLKRSWRPFEPRDEQLSQQMVAQWAGFMKKGDPNGRDLPTWNPYSSHTHFVLSFK